MRRLKQTDKRWATTKIGNTNLTIGRWGCLITSLCMLHSKWYPKNYIKPPEAAKTWDFTSNGLLRWSTTNFTGMAFKWRDYSNHKSIIKEYAKDKNKGVVVEVNNYHWCAVWNWSIFGIILFDPIDGKIYWGLPRKYKITGYATFIRKLSE